MSRRRRPRRLSPAISLTPMLDIIFNLLFFLIVSTRLRDQAFEMDVSLPEARGTEPATQQQPSPLTLTPDGRVHFRGRAMTDVELELEMTHLSRSGEREVLLRADQTVDYGRVVEVMGICRGAGLQGVVLDVRNSQADRGR